VSTTPVSSSATKATKSSHSTQASSVSKTLNQDETVTSSSEAAQTSLRESTPNRIEAPADSVAKSEDQTTDSAESTSTQEANPDTTFVFGTVTYTGAAAVSAAEFAKTGDHKTAKNGMSSFAIIGQW